MKTVDPFKQSKSKSSSTTVKNGAGIMSSMRSISPQEILRALQTVTVIFETLESMYAELQHTERVREMEWTKQKEIQRQMNKDQFDHREKMAEIEQRMKKTDEISQTLANTEIMLLPLREKANLMLEWVMNEKDSARRKDFMSELSHFFNEINTLETHITTRLEKL